MSTTTADRQVYRIEDSHGHPKGWKSDETDAIRLADDYVAQRPEDGPYVVREVPYAERDDPGMTAYPVVYTTAVDE